MTSLVKQSMMQLSICLAIILSLNLSLFLAQQLPSLSGFFILVWLLSWLLGLKFKKKKRYQHILLLMIELGLTILMAFVLYNVFQQYNSAVVSLSPKVIAILNQIFTLFHTSVPVLQSQLLIVFSIIYACLLLIIRSSFITFFNKKDEPLAFVTSEIYELAYIQEEDGLYLKPWFSFARSFCLIPLVIGSGLLLWYSNSAININQQAATWLIWLHILLIAFAVDWFYWLSGKPHELESMVEFDGDDEDAKQQLLFEDLWKRYHKFWKEKWLVAGNKSTGPKIQ